MKQMALIALWIYWCIGCDSRVPDLEGHTKYVSTKTSHGRVRYGVAYGELIYVIFDMRLLSESIKEDPEFRIVIGKKRDGLIETRDAAGNYGTSSSQLFEWRSGAYLECAGVVTIKELEAFLSSRPKEYSVRELLLHARRGCGEEINPSR